MHEPCNARSFIERPDRETIFFLVCIVYVSHKVCVALLLIKRRYSPMVSKTRNSTWSSIRWEIARYIIGHAILFYGTDCRDWSLYFCSFHSLDTCLACESGKTGDSAAFHFLIFPFFYFFFLLVKESLENERESPSLSKRSTVATLRINIRNDSSRALDHHFVLYVLVPLVLFVFVAEAAHRETILRIFGHVGCIRVDAFYVDGRQRPREGRCLQVRYGWMPRGQVSWLFRLAVPRGQFLDDLQIEVTDYNSTVSFPCSTSSTDYSKPISERS